MESGRLESGAKTFDVKRGESPGMRYLHFERWLEDIGARAEIVVYEQVIPVEGAGVMAREIAYGFATRVQGYCARRGIDHSAVYPSTLKKWTTGKGNAKKTEMLEAVARRWLRVDDHNEADAVALLHYALVEVVPAGAGGRA
jgi:Holliday junction resolvasome RuvABC endonuclease subunit